ncbi:MAG: ATP-binding protein [Desulfobacterales bacterium]
MNAAKLSMVLKNDLTELGNLSMQIEKFCNLQGISKRNTFKLNLVVDEVFTNIVSYGFSNQKEHLIQIDISIIGDELMIRIEDDGMPFDPTAIPENNLSCSLEDRQIGGLGLHLINRIMGSITYERVLNKNVLILKKYLDKK